LYPKADNGQKRRRIIRRLPAATLCYRQAFAMLRFNKRDTLGFYTERFPQALADVSRIFLCSKPAGFPSCRPEIVSEFNPKRL
jgi:hypothetical protein